jgi:hypothetical protein
MQRFTPIEAQIFAAITAGERRNYLAALTANCDRSDTSGAVNNSACSGGGTRADLIGTPPFGEVNSPLQHQIAPLPELPCWCHFECNPFQNTSQSREACS